MKIIEREKCAVTDISDLEPLYTFSKFPVFMGCTNQPEHEDLREDMSWWISRGSGLIQLKNLLPLEILYPESHGAGEIGTLWAKHHQEFASYIYRVSPSAILEIGGAHGILQREYQEYDDIPWTILEPNPSPVAGCSARFIKGFFSENFNYTDEFDTIVHSHVLEHIYEPDKFMAQLSRFMSNGKRMLFSVPNMRVMLERMYTNCINFEHTTFLTETYIDYLLSKHGFRLVSKDYFLDDHSIFYSVVRDVGVKHFNLPPSQYEHNKSLYNRYISYHESLIHDLNSRLIETERPSYLFGAHVFAQYLIEMGLRTDRLIGLLDNDPAKQGRRLYGTPLYVMSPKALKEVNDPLVILKAGVYNEEIKSDILRNINDKVLFLE